MNQGINSKTYIIKEHISFGYLLQDELTKMKNTSLVGVLEDHPQNDFFKIRLDTINEHPDIVLNNVFIRLKNKLNEIKTTITNTTS